MSYELERKRKKRIDELSKSLSSSIGMLKSEIGTLDKVSTSIGRRSAINTHDQYDYDTAEGVDELTREGIKVGKKKKKKKTRRGKKRRR